MRIVGDIATAEGRQRVRRVEGELNVSSEARLDNIRRAIRRGLPQVRGHQVQGTRIAIVGSGPSLKHTVAELRELAWRGCPIVAMNGSYEWLIKHNIRPTSMVVIDARAFNARFLTEPVTGCTYFLASQCAPDVFDKVREWPNHTFVWHCLVGDDPKEKELLDGFYLGQWQPVFGGCTVGTRAIVLFRILGFRSIDLFGMDSCCMEGEDHALPQPENAGDPVETIICAGRSFKCTAWQTAQALEFIDLIASNGEHFQLNVHGDGLLAHIMRVGGAACEDLKEARSWQ